MTIIAGPFQMILATLAALDLINEETAERALGRLYNVVPAATMEGMIFQIRGALAKDEYEK